MATLSILMAVALAGPADNSGPKHAVAPRSAESAVRPLSATELREAISFALRREATTDGAAHDRALPDLIAIYNELEQNQLLPEAERQQRRGQIRYRLAAAADELERQAAGAQRNQAPARNARQPARNVRTVADNAGPQAVAALLAQRAAGAAPAARAPAAGPGLPAGGAARQPGGVTEADQAQQLIDLIRTTIAPHTWDINGGPGTIMYFAPKQVLVVRQTAEVHGHLRGVVRQLRRN